MKKFESFFYSILLIAILFTPIIVTNNINAETSKRITILDKYRVGAICCDGWRSNATGRGTCSHHDGVYYWIIYDDESGEYSKEYTGRCN